VNYIHTSRNTHAGQPHAKFWNKAKRVPHPNLNEIFFPYLATLTASMGLSLLPSHTSQAFKDRLPRYFSDWYVWDLLMLWDRIRYKLQSKQKPLATGGIAQSQEASINDALNIEMAQSTDQVYVSLKRSEIKTGKTGIFNNAFDYQSTPLSVESPPASRTVCAVGGKQNPSIQLHEGKKTFPWLSKLVA